MGSTKEAAGPGSPGIRPRCAHHDVAVTPPWYVPGASLRTKGPA